MSGAVTPEFPSTSLGASEDLPGWIGRGFDRRALAPRLGILTILLVGALADYGHGHRAGHWIVLVAYGAATLAAALAARSRSRQVIAGLPVVATCVDAAIAIYVIADHVPRHPGDAALAANAVSLLPAFLFLLQTGLRLRPRLTALFVILVGSGWMVSLAVLMDRSLLAPGSGTSVLFREGLSLVAFFAAAGFVLYSSLWMRRAANLTMRAREERVMLSRFLPAGVASEVVRTGGTARVAQRHATLISVDLRGSSALAREHSPDQVVEWLLDFRRLVHDAVTKQEGIIDKYVGDGVLGLFLDGDKAAQAARALAAIEAIFEELRSLNEERTLSGVPRLRVIAVIHCGQVLAGVFDDGRRAEFTVLGPSMNDLSRIERRAKEANLDFVVSANILELLDAATLDRMPARELAPPTQARALPALYALGSKALLNPARTPTAERSRPSRVPD